MKSENSFIKKTITFIKNNRTEIIIYLTTFFIASLCTFFVVGGTTIMSGSMEPYLYKGDKAILTKKFVYGEIKRGDVIVFNPPYGENLYCKRVIGVGGDEIFLRDGYVYLNGEKQDEEYVKGVTEYPTDIQEVFVVPEGKVFVMGDNRESSFDSRMWEDPYIPTSDVVGKVVYKLPW